MIRDYLGNALAVGDYFVYAALRNRTVGMRIARVLSTENGLKVAAAEYSGWRAAWIALRGCPDSKKSVRVPRVDVPAEVRELLGDTN